MQATSQDIDTLARTLYGEARGETLRGQIAVAHVVLNRVQDPGWWTRNRGDGIPDDTIAAACRDPWQFSCWNAGDPNREKIEAVTLNEPSFQRAMAVACAVVRGLDGFGDPTGGATHYHTRSISPDWDWSKLSSPMSIGHHKFYRKIG